MRNIPNKLSVREKMCLLLTISKVLKVVADICVHHIVYKNVKGRPL